MDIKKCSLKKHCEIDAIYFCPECKLNFCNKCENHHSELFENHHLFKLDQNKKEIFTGFCKEENHFNKLSYFCKTHNQLCCAACISKIKGKGNGQHTDCEVVFIEKIKNEKKKSLKDNIKKLENFSNILEETINQLKITFNKIKDEKEELKLKIQKIFTKLRNKINEREDELLLQVDEQIDNLFYNENIIKENEKLPNKIKLSIEKGKIIDDEWENEDKLSSIINDCINIENDIKNINDINENIQKCKSNKTNIKFSSADDVNNKLLKIINEFGNLYFSKNFEFKFCPSKINNKKKYIVSGEKKNIITKQEYSIIDVMYSQINGIVGVLCENSLEKNREYRWKIKIIKTQHYEIFVGVSPIDFDINKSSFNKCYGWYLSCENLKLYSGPPHNYKEKKTNLGKKNEIIVIMNMKNGTLKFITDKEDNENYYTNIPLDKPITPAVILCNPNDSVEINEC